MVRKRKRVYAEASSRRSPILVRAGRYAPYDRATSQEDERLGHGRRTQVRP